MFQSRLLKIAVPLPTSMMTNRWWHGTTEKAADAILKEGIKATGNSYESGYLEPQENRSYFASTLVQAINYSLFRTPFDETKPTTLYIFEISSKSLNDVTLDEDSVEMIIDFYFHRLEKFKQVAPEFAEDRLYPTWSKEDLEKPAVKELAKFLLKRFKHYKDPTKLDHEDIMSIIQDIPANIVIDLIEQVPFSITSDGVIWPDKLWKLTIPPFSTDLIVGELDDEKLRELWNHLDVDVININR